MTGTTVDILPIDGMCDYLPNHVLSQVLQQSFEATGAPEFDEKDQMCIRDRFILLQSCIKAAFFRKTGWTFAENPCFTELFFPFAVLRFYLQQSIIYISHQRAWC